MGTTTRREKRRKGRSVPLRILGAGGMEVLKKRGPMVDAGHGPYTAPSASPGPYRDVRYLGGLWSCGCAYHASGRAALPKN